MKQPKDYYKLKFFPDIRYLESYMRESENLKEIELSKIEIQAIKLKDIEGYSDKKCSKIMGITVKDFEKIICKARKKVAIALDDGRCIKIIIKEEEIKEDLSDLKACKFRCATCGYIYYVNYEFQEIVCPKCNSTKVMSSEEAGFFKKWSYKK